MEKVYDRRILERVRTQVQVSHIQLLDDILLFCEQSINSLWNKFKVLENLSICSSWKLNCGTSPSSTDSRSYNENEVSYDRILNNHLSSGFCRFWPSFCSVSSREMQLVSKQSRCLPNYYPSSHFRGRTS